MTVMRRATDLLLIGLALSVLILGLASVVAPQVGSGLLAIRTGSMAPSIPVGALIVTRAVDPHALAVGDTVTVRLDSGVALTHRIDEIVERDGKLGFRLKGDANEAPDPALISADRLIGSVALSIWGLGVLLWMLSTPSGIVAVLSGIGTLLVGGWLLDEFDPSAIDREANRPRRRLRRRPSRRTTVALGLALLLIGGSGATPTSTALATATKSVPSSITADVLDPPSNATCNGGVAMCSVALLTKPTISWTATPDPYATGYRVLRSTTSGSGYAQIGTVTGRTTTTFTDTTVGALTTYYYVVRSVADVWVSANSNQVTVTVLA